MIAAAVLSNDEVDPNLARAREGDLSAFNALVLQHQQAVYGLCYRILNDAQCAEDASQDAFISAWRNLGSLRSGDFRPWLMTITANTCRTHLRKKAIRSSSSLDQSLEMGMPDPTESAWEPEAIAVSQELRATIDAALRQLPPDQRLALTLRDIEGFNYLEIAAATRCTMGTVKSRIARARLRMRDLLAAEFFAATEPA